jgi:hypothetical protein
MLYRVSPLWGSLLRAPEVGAVVGRHRATNGSRFGPGGKDLSGVGAEHALGTLDQSLAQRAALNEGVEVRDQLLVVAGVHRDPGPRHLLGIGPAVAGDGPVTDNGGTARHGLHRRQPAGIFDHHVSGGHELVHVVHPPEHPGLRSRRATLEQRGAQGRVPPGHHERDGTPGVKESVESGGDLAHPPRAGNHQDGWLARLQAERPARRRTVPPPACESGPHHRAAHDRAPPAARHELGALRLVDQQVSVDPRVGPHAVDEEIEYEGDHGYLQLALGPHTPGDLRAEMEGGNDQRRFGNGDYLAPVPPRRSGGVRR